MRLLYCRKLYRKAFVFRPKRSSYVTEERKFVTLFAATILAARKLIDLDPNKPNMAKGFFVDRAIEDAAFILERIDARWPGVVNSFSGKDCNVLDASRIRDR